MTNQRTACWWLVLLPLASACDKVIPSVTWERMLDQKRGKAYAASSYFDDGKLMQAPPEGTVPADVTDIMSEGRARQSDGSYVTTLPWRVDHAILARGQTRFETFCATCHGLDGSGQSEVARHMELRQPPSLVTDPVRSLPTGQYYEVMSAGYGLMPSYAHDLDDHDRWTVVAYLRALQRSQATELAKLPPAIQQQAKEQLR